MNDLPVRLIAADMDGSLLDNEHNLPPDFDTVFSELRRRGIVFAAASGRQYFNIAKKFPGKNDDMLFIAENGSLVTDGRRELFVQAMDPEIARAQIRAARTLPGVYPILCGKKRAYIDNNTPAFVEKLSLYYDRYAMVNDLLEVDDDEFLKIALCDFEGAESNSYGHFRDKQDILQVKVSGKIWLDLAHPLANKGRALRFLQEMLGVEQRETMVFGDYLNDLEMMNEAHYSFAMANAHPDVIRASRFRAPGNADYGVTRVISQLLKGELDKFVG